MPVSKTRDEKRRISASVRICSERVGRGAGGAYGCRIPDRYDHKTNRRHDCSVVEDDPGVAHCVRVGCRCRRLGWHGRKPPEPGWGRRSSEKISHQSDPSNRRSYAGRGVRAVFFEPTRSQPLLQGRKFRFIPLISNCDLSNSEL